jgi:hypothetical protein
MRGEGDYSFEVFVIYILFLFSLFLGSCLLTSHLEGQRELELKALEYREKKELIQAVRAVFGVGEAREDSIFTPPSPPLLDWEKRRGEKTGEVLLITD